MRSTVVALALFALAAPVAAQTATPPAPTTGYGSWFGSVPNMERSGAGIVLDGVTAGSPAAKAGLKAGDVIVRMAGTETSTLAEMVTVLRAHKPGEAITVVYFRGEATDSVQVTLRLRPGS